MSRMCFLYIFLTGTDEILEFKLAKDLFGNNGFFIFKFWNFLLTKHF